MTERLIIIMPSHENGPGLWGVVDGDAYEFILTPCKQRQSATVFAQRDFL